VAEEGLERGHSVPEAGGMGNREGVPLAHDEAASMEDALGGRGGRRGSRVPSGALRGADAGRSTLEPGAIMPARGPVRQPCRASSSTATSFRCVGRQGSGMALASCGPLRPLWSNDPGGRCPSRPGSAAGWPRGPSPPWPSARRAMPACSPRQPAPRGRGRLVGAGARAVFARGIRPVSWFPAAGLPGESLNTAVNREFIQRLLATGCDFDLERGGLYDARSGVVNLRAKRRCWSLGNCFTFAGWVSRIRPIIAAWGFRNKPGPPSLASPARRKRRGGAPLYLGTIMDG
jgi:hypothetical protein